MWYKVKRVHNMYNRHAGHFCYGQIECDDNITFHVLQKVHELEPKDTLFKAEINPILVCEEKGLEFNIFLGSA